MFPALTASFSPAGWNRSITGRLAADPRNGCWRMDAGADIPAADGRFRLIGVVLIVRRNLRDGSESQVFLRLAGRHPKAISAIYFLHKDLLNLYPAPFRNRNCKYEAWAS